MKQNKSASKNQNRNRNNQKETLKKILQYVKKYRLLIFCTMVLAAITAAFTLYIPVLVGKAIDCIVYQNVDFDRILIILCQIGILILITALTQWSMNVINNKVTFQVVRDIRKRAFLQIERLPLKYIDSHSYGEVVSRVITDVDQFADGLLLGFTQFFTGVVTILGTLFFMMLIHPGIAFVVVLVTPLSLLVANFIAKRTFSMFQKQSVARGDLTGFVEEMLGNAKVVKAFGYEDRAMKEFETMNQDLRKYSLRAIFYSSITNPATRFVNSVAYTGVALAGGLVALGGGITVGALSAFLSYANQYTKPFNEISEVITELQNAIACAGRIFELIEEEPQPEDRKDAKELINANGSVYCQNVSFSYTPDKKLIQDFNLTVKPGQKVAIVGPTGCGKTTIINLLMRFYDIEGGSIQVEGTDIRDITRKSLRQSYGMVLQETWLRMGTIRDNIAMGKMDATQEEIVAAAKASYADSFIRRLPNGYDTIIGEDGGMLSQGQKQLLCIARVMLCQPPMLILDEATSSIDTRTEMKIQSAFAALMEGKTSFLVAHRLTTIQNADIILVMQDGNIVEQGNHEQLLARQGFYASLYHS